MGVMAVLLLLPGEGIANTVPQAPTISAPTQAPVGANLTFVVEAVDPDTDQVRYQVDWNGDGTVEETTSFSFSGTVQQIFHAFQEAGDFVVQVRAEDIAGGFSSWTQHTIMITIVNSGPTFDPTGNFSAQENRKLQFSVSAKDPDGDTLTYAALGMPQGASFSESTFEGRTFYVFAWTPSYEQSGTYRLTFLVDDSRGGSDREEVVVTVYNVTQDEDNRAPSITKITAHSISADTIVVRWQTDEDAVGRVDYGVSKAHGSRTSFTGTFTKTGEHTISGLKAGTVHHFKLTVKDAAGNEMISGDRTVVVRTQQEEDRITSLREVRQGSLIRERGDDRIFVVINGRRSHIPNAEVFIRRGYKWDDIMEVDPNVSREFVETPILVRAHNDTAVYRIINGQRHHVSSPQSFQKQGLSWDAVVSVSSEEIIAYPRPRLIRPEGESTVYYINQAGFRKGIPSEAIFRSYNNAWRDVTIVPSEVLEGYPQAQFIRRAEGTRIYLLTGTTKRWVKTADIFRKRGYDWNAVTLVNDQEFSFYEEGTIIDS